MTRKVACLLNENLLHHHLRTSISRGRTLLDSESSSWWWSSSFSPSAPMPLVLREWDDYFPLVHLERHTYEMLVVVRVIGGLHSLCRWDVETLMSHQDYSRRTSFLHMICLNNRSKSSLANRLHGRSRPSVRLQSHSFTVYKTKCKRNFLCNLLL